MNAVRMRRVTTLFLLGLLTLSASEPSQYELPVDREARLRATLAQADLSPDEHYATTLELAELWVHAVERNFDEALKLLEPLLASLEASESTAPEKIEDVQHTLAFAYSYTGRNDLAEKLLLRARDSRLQRLGPNHPHTIGLRGDLAVFYGRIGRHELSEPELREIARLRAEENPDGDEALHSRTHWAITLGRLGRWTEAETVLRDVIARRVRLLGADDPRLAHQFSLLSWVLYSTDRATEAIPLLEHLLKLREEALGKTSAPAFNSRHNLASAYARVGRYEEAETLWRADLALTEAGSNEGQIEPAAYLRKLGELSLQRGNLAQAINDLTQSEAAFQEPRSTGWRDAANRDLEGVRFSLARAQHAHGERDAAIRTATHWIGLLEDQYRLHLMFTSEVERLAFHRETKPFDLPGTLGDPELLARATLRFKGLVLDSLIEDQHLASSDQDPETASLLAQYRAHLANEVVAPNADSNFSLSERERLERELALRTRASTNTRAALKANPADIIAALPHDTAFVDFVRYTRLTLDAEQPDYYVALIGTRAHGWQTIDLDRAQEIDAAIERYLILTTRGGPIEWATTLRQIILDPIRARLPKTITRLVISPDANLHRIAFATLPEDDGKTLALHRHAFAHVTSGRDLLSDARRDTTPPPADALAIAQPMWTGELAQLESLPASMIEAKTFARFASNARIATREEATPATLIAHGSPRWLHIATHAMAETDSQLSPTDAMRRTGLALAGDRGWFNALQIAALDLRATELVFLSACSTGSGTTASGEGVLGLQRGFARAGARTLITTLWRVGDDESKELAAEFYRELTTTPKDPVEALRAAQRTHFEQLRKDGVSIGEALRRIGAHIIHVRQ